MNQPTGQQFEIRHGTTRAVVTEVGAGLRAFEVDSVPYMETYPDSEAPPSGSGSVLLPWPNRVAGAQWQYQGRPQRLAVTEPARGNAIHGLVRHRSWTVVEQAEDAIVLEVGVPEQTGWPVPLRATIGYAVDARGLTVTHGVRNVGEQSVPFGVGTHPYPRAGLSAAAECELRLGATTVLPLDETRMVPDGPPRPVEATEFDYRAPRSLAGAKLDTPFGGCLPDADGLIHHRLTGPAGGVELWADPDFRWVQVFLTDQYPKRPQVIAIEPMTCPPDALNSGIDLITLAPGESWTGRWGLSPLRI